MFRRIVAMAMLASFVAMSSSGMMMFFVEQPSFTIRMHPVHKLFGLLMVLAGTAHVLLNLASLRAHLRLRWPAVALSLLTVLLIVLYAAVWQNPVPADLAGQMDEAARAAESRPPMK